MWVFTKYGFYSIACAADLETKMLDVNKVMVRARMRSHLVHLKVRFPELESTPIVCSDKNDYMYRMTMPKIQWAGILYELSMEQTWSNFKDAAGAFEKLHKLAFSYVDALHEIWSVMFQVQTQDKWRDLRLLRGSKLSKKEKKRLIAMEEALK